MCGVHTVAIDLARSVLHYSFQTAKISQNCGKSKIFLTFFYFRFSFRRFRRNFAMKKETKSPIRAS